MPLFFYKASDRYGKIIEGVLSYSSKDEAIAEIQRLGFYPIKVEVKERSSPSKKVSRKDVLVFTQGLANLLLAGIPLDGALLLMSDMFMGSKMKELVRDLRRNVQKGRPLFQSMEVYSYAFSPLYVNMVRVGEECGALAQILQRLAQLLEREERTISTLRASLIYPSMVLLLAGGAIVVLLTFVVPRFADILDDLGGSLPLSTHILLQVSTLIQRFWWLVIPFILLALVSLNGFTKTPQGRLLWDRLKLKIPLIGPLNQIIIVERISRLLATMTSSGIPLVDSLSIACHSAGNKVFAQGLIDISQRIREGESFARHIKEKGLFPNSAAYLVEVGEETGDLSQMLQKVADIYGAEIEAKIKAFLSLFEPVVILITAGVVLMIVISILLPILSMNNILL